MADEWFATRQDTYAAANIKKKRWLISLPNARIGEMPITKLTPSDILGAIRPIEAAGHTVTAHKLVGTAGQICRFARACGYIVFNPAAALKEVLKPIKSKHYATITDPASVGHLLRCIDEYQGSVVVGYALKICGAPNFAAGGGQRLIWTRRSGQSRQADRKTPKAAAA